jgi:hypothetical protein
MVAVAAALAGCQTAETTRENPIDRPEDPPKWSGERYTAFWDTRPQQSRLVFHGVSGKLSDPEEEVRLALEDAARRVALFHAAKGTFTHLENIGAGLFDYSSTREGSISTDENYRDLVDALEFDPETDVLVTDYATFVRTRYTVSEPLHLSYAPAHRAGRPEWIDNPPADRMENSGFLVGIGHANPRLYHKDTVIASYENALYALVGAVSQGIESTSETRTLDNSFAGFNSSSAHTARASEDLQGFYVLETWTDPGNWGVYTLAIARKP